MARVILVDPYARRVYEEDMDLEQLTPAQEYVGGFCEHVPLAAWIRRHAMFVDEDAKLKKDRQPQWRIPGSVDFEGKAVIFGTDGVRFTDATVTEEAVQEMIQWL